MSTSHQCCQDPGKQRPRSKVAQEIMDVFKVAWESQVQILTDAVDDIVTVDDFLAAVSENHILTQSRY